MNTNTGRAPIKTQKERLLEYLLQHGSVDRFRAMKRPLGIANLPEIVRQLRKDGHRIDSVKIRKVNMYGEKTNPTEYTLRKPEAAE